MQAKADDQREEKPGGADKPDGIPGIHLQEDQDSVVGKSVSGIQASCEASQRPKLGSFDGIPHEKASGIRSRLDELFRNIRGLRACFGNRSLASPPYSDVLLEAMEKMQNASSKSSRSWHVQEAGNPHQPESERSVASREDHGYPSRNDEQMAIRSGIGKHQETVGEHSLSGQGPITSGNRLVRTRMPGGVGRGS